jgi:anaerobic ribonucleoside-triphosphate reductase
MAVKVATKKFIRVVGYYGSTDNINEGKSQEYADRKTFGLG